MPLSHHLLQDDGHLLLVDDIAGGRHIVLAASVIHAGIDSTYSLREHGQPLILVTSIGNHIGTVYTRKGLVMGILQQAAAAHGYRPIHHMEEGFQVAQQAHRQPCTQEVLQNLFVGDVTQSHLIQVIGIHKLIKDVGTEHHRLGYLHRHALPLI